MSSGFRRRLDFTDGRQELVETDAVHRTGTAGEAALSERVTGDGDPGELLELRRLPAAARAERAEPVRH